MARSVILDLGTRPRAQYQGRRNLPGMGFAYCATCDAEFFKGRKSMCWGAGDQAIERESDYLTGFASKVTIVVLHEEGHLDCNEVAAEHAYKNPKIDFVWSSTVQEIKGSDHVESLVLKNVDTGRGNRGEGGRSVPVRGHGAPDRTGEGHGGLRQGRLH